MSRRNPNLQEFRALVFKLMMNDPQTAIEYMTLHNSVRALTGCDEQVAELLVMVCSHWWSRYLSRVNDRNASVQIVRTPDYKAEPWRQN